MVDLDMVLLAFIGVQNWFHIHCKLFSSKAKKRL
jgi:hypothetical protein